MKTPFESLFGKHRIVEYVIPEHMDSILRKKFKRKLKRENHTTQGAACRACNFGWVFNNFVRTPIIFRSYKGLTFSEFYIYRPKKTTPEWFRKDEFVLAPTKNGHNVVVRISLELQFLLLLKAKERKRK